MKLKEIDRTANIAWSPANWNKTILSVATAGQQLDATFSTKSSLELFLVDFSDTSQDMEVSRKIEIDSRLYKLLWSSSSNEMLIGGAEEGQMYIWGAQKIFEQEENVLLHKLTKHTGVIAALDINAFQSNLLASGGGDSEIYIWDLLNLENPLVPGQKSLPLTDVSCVSWNRQVKSILASSNAGTCILWDLRKNEPIIKIRDSLSRIKCNQLCWHPDVATQLCLASEDDHSPFLQIWDLRSATAPIRQLESHERGILSVAWCPHDSDLLLSCGKDNRIICWNPNMESRNGEIVYELPISNQWCFDVQWCPRQPGIISASSFDGHVGIYSLMGGKPSNETTSRVTGAFGADNLLQQKPYSIVGAPVETTLKYAPKWMKKPCGASFGFGGKLVSFSNTKDPSGINMAKVIMLQLVTEPEFVERSNVLDEVLNSGHLVEFCEMKASQSINEHEADIWRYIKVNFSDDPQSEYLKLLGNDITNYHDKVKVENYNGYNSENNSDEGDMSKEFSKLGTDLQFNLDSDWSGDVTRALLIGNFEDAVEICLRNGKHVEALLLANSAGPKVIHKTQMRVLGDNDTHLNKLIRGIIFGDFQSLVMSLNLKNWKEMLALILTYTTSHDLLNLSNLLGERLKNCEDISVSQNSDLCYIVSGNVDELITKWTNKVPTHSDPLELQSLIEKIMVLKKSFNSSHRLQENIFGGENFVDPLIQYGKLLGEQGCMAAALKYLQNFDDNSINFLKDRCYISLGQPKWAPIPKKPFQIMNLGSSNYPQKLQHQPLMQKNSQPSVQPYMPHQFVENQNARSKNNSTSYYQKENVFNQQSQPARLAGPTYPTPHVLAPNIYSNTAVINAPQNNTGIPYPPQIEPNYNARPASNFLAQSALRGPLGKYNSNPPHQTNGQNLISSTQMRPMNSGDFSSLTPSNDSNYILNNVVPAIPKVTTAWNDPPYAQSSLHPKVEHKVPAFQGVLYNPQDYQATDTVVTPQYSQNLKPASTPSYAPQQQPRQAIEEKRPISEEDKIIVDILNRLTNLCLQVLITNPMAKKKMEDVLKKIEILHNMLANLSLSQSTLVGLHNIVTCMQQFDYSNALHHYSTIVSQGSFSEVSHFLPAIKTLILTAQQYQIYLQ